MGVGVDHFGLGRAQPLSFGEERRERVGVEGVVHRLHPIAVAVAWQVVIAGGGFGGFYAARALERLLPAQSARVTLVNEANFMLYTPLLPGAAGRRSTRATWSCRCARSCGAPTS